MGHVQPLDVAAAGHDRDREPVGDELVEQQVEALDQQQGPVTVQPSRVDVRVVEPAQRAVQVSGADQADAFRHGGGHVGKPQELDRVAEVSGRLVRDAAARGRHLLELGPPPRGDRDGRRRPRRRVRRVLDQQREALEGEQERAVRVRAVAVGAAEACAQILREAVDARRQQTVHVEFAVPGLPARARVVGQAGARGFELVRRWRLVRCKAAHQQFEVVHVQARRREHVPREPAAAHLPGEAFRRPQRRGHVHRAFPPVHAVLAVQAAPPQLRHPRRRRWRLAPVRSVQPCHAHHSTVPHSSPSKQNLTEGPRPGHPMPRTSITLIL
jgi:hypothetical protein